MMHYEQFSAEDFSQDPDFIKWVRSPDDHNRRLWDEWIALHPEKENEIKEARELVRLLQYEVVRPSAEVKARAKENIERIILKNSTAPTRRLSWYRWAAVFAGLTAVVGIGLSVFNSPAKMVETAYGETKTVTLEDGSVVTLNGNSSIRFEDLAEAELREVHLTGEAFFKVEHLADNRKFVVVADRLQVEVLGTEFNINSRVGNTSVVLSSGALSVAIGKWSHTETLEMKPGDMVAYAGSTDEVVRKEVDPASYASWTRNILVFEETPLEEIASLLKHTYGYEVTMAADVKPLLFTGTVPADNLSVLFNGLRRTHELDIVVEKNHILIEN